MTEETKDPGVLLEVREYEVGGYRDTVTYAFNEAVSIVITTSTLQICAVLEDGQLKVKDKLTLLKEQDATIRQDLVSRGLELAGVASKITCTNLTKT